MGSVAVDHVVARSIVRSAPLAPHESAQWYTKPPCILQAVTTAESVFGASLNAVSFA
jgi:hypothetical protein